MIKIGDIYTFKDLSQGNALSEMDNNVVIVLKTGQGEKIAGLDQVADFRVLLMEDVLESSKTKDMRSFNVAAKELTPVE